MAQEALKSKLRHLPDRPGVYLMKDAAGDLIYFGNSNSVLSRVRSYFAASQQHSL